MCEKKIRKFKDSKFASIFDQQIENKLKISLKKRRKVMLAEK